MIAIRKPDEEKLYNVTIGLTASEIERLDKMADRVGHSRRKLASDLFLLSLELMEDYERLKLVTLAVFVRDKVNLASLKKAFRKCVVEWDEEMRTKES